MANTVWFLKADCFLQWFQHLLAGSKYFTFGFSALKHAALDIYGSHFKIQKASKQVRSPAQNASPSAVHAADEGRASSLH